MLKLIKALDLQHWADTKESEALMPELMRRLQENEEQALSDKSGVKKE